MRYFKIKQNIKKDQKGRPKGISTNKRIISRCLFYKKRKRKIRYNWAVKIMNIIYLTKEQIEAARGAIKRITKRSKKLHLYIYPYKPRTKKPADTRMGKGKPKKINSWISSVKKGQMLFKLRFNNSLKSMRTLYKAKFKFPCNSQIFKIPR